jgi:hypothetical protein
MRRSAAAILIALAVMHTSSRVSAWGAVGHHVVARIAWSLMSATARDRAAALLDGRQDAFVASATWADEVRSAKPETYNWHFVDIPVGEPKYSATRDCPATEKGDCVIAEIARARAELADASRPQAARAESLKFLIHFIGDIHQPLHAIDNHDRGGNDVRVAALRGDDGRATNLHAAWDTGLINLSTETEAARADRLLADLGAHPADLKADVVQWAEQSHTLAETVAYHYPGFSRTGPPADLITLDQPYRDEALKTIDRQIALAGARLAAVLNAILSDK